MRIPKTMILGLVMQASISSAQAPARSTIFRVEADEFWLNLHHFLYVLGRAEAKTTDSARPAVAGAPADAERGLPCNRIGKPESLPHIGSQNTRNTSARYRK